MPRQERQYWEADYGLTGRPADARGFYYEAFVPDPIADLQFAIPLELAHELEEANRAVASLQNAASLTGLEAISRQLLRAESIASSRIEGLQLSQRRLARAMLDPNSEGATARAIVGNIHAMEEAVLLGTLSRSIRVEDILSLHRRLLEGITDAVIAGTVRDGQNWIGGSDLSPRGAEFIPPPALDVCPLLEDLCLFLNRQDVPAILQAAIAHAQFETIHPFADGNGRVGRALIHMVLKRRLLAPHVVPPISLVLATNGQRYVEGLNAYRQERPMDWCAFFVRVVDAASRHAWQLNVRLQDLQQEWHQTAGRPRRGSAAYSLIGALPAYPVLDLRLAAQVTGGSIEGARKALNALEQAGVLVPVVVGKKRNRVWEARELLYLLDQFEWELATPTRPSQSRRPSPRPRRQAE